MEFKKKFSLIYYFSIYLMYFVCNIIEKSNRVIVRSGLEIDNNNYYLYLFNA